MISLRSYQQAALDGILAKWREGSRATIACLPTGTGKTIVFGALAKQITGRMLVVAHLRQLIHQAAEKIEMVTGERPVIEMADRREGSANCLFGVPPSRVVVASVQSANAGQRCSECEGTGSIDDSGDMQPRACQACLDGLTRRMERFDPFAFTHLVIDECHHSRTASYERLIKYMSRNPELKILGVSATPRRHDRRGMGTIFDSVAYEYPLLSAISDGYLLKPKQQFVTVRDLDFSQCKMSGGDYSAIDLQRRMTQERPLHEHVTPVIDLAGDRPTFFLASGITHAQLACDIFNRHKPNSAIYVNSLTPDEERRNLLDRYHRGEFQYLCGVGCFTEGFDEPRISCVVTARPTRSEPLYCQMVGRGLRPINPPTEATAELRRAAIALSSKPDCLIIDVAGNSTTHKLVSTISTADLLSAGLEKGIAERAVCRIRESGKPSDMRETMEEIAREDEKRRQEEEAARWAAVKAKAIFHAREIDPCNPFATSPKHVRKRKRDGKQLSEKQRAFLERRGISTEGLSRRKATRLIGERMKREEGEPCTERQSRVLLSNGLPGDLTKREAHRVLSAIENNGWKVPDEIRQQCTQVEVR